MCIIIVGKDVKTDVLRNAWNANPHGGGFMFVSKHGVEIRKGFMDFDKFVEAYDPYRQYTVAIHFRIATSGVVSKAMTHPFMCGDIAFCHNGVLPEYELGYRKSDTYYFGRKFVAQNSINDVIKKMTEYAAIGNKFAVLHGSKLYIIGNFIKIDGVYFSNRSFMRRHDYFNKQNFYLNYGG